MATYATVKGNTSPGLIVNLRRAKKPIDLVDANKVEMIIRDPTTKQITNGAHQECTILNVAGGQIGYQVEVTDFPSTKDKIEYPAEVKITYDDGKKETIYEKLTIVVRQPV